MNHACPYTTIGFDITISGLAPCPSFDLTSSNVTNILSANADSHLQKHKRKKLGRNYKKKTTTGTSAIGDRVIGDILAKNMILIPLAIDPFGQFRPILQHSLFNTPPTNPITFTNTKPNATLMYSNIMQFPSPKGVLTLANHNWKTTSTRQFYGHSYSAPNPTITALQQLGLTITKTFALHIHCATKKLHDHSLPTSPPGKQDPPSFGQQVGF